MKLYKVKSIVDRQNRQTSRQIKDEEEEEKNTRKKNSRKGIQAVALDIQLNKIKSIHYRNINC